MMENNHNDVVVSGGGGGGGRGVPLETLVGDVLSIAGYTLLVTLFHTDIYDLWSSIPQNTIIHCN